MPKIHLGSQFAGAPTRKRKGVFDTTATECSVTPAHPRLATNDRSKVTCLNCLGTGRPTGRRKSGVKPTAAQLLDVLQEIMQVLGPSPVCACAGCAWETDAALQLLRSVGIDYKGRKIPPPVPHDPNVEAQGNAVETIIVGVRSKR